MNHVDYETLVAYSLKKLDTENIDKVRSHLSQCDLCYRNFAIISVSLIEIKATEATKTPKKLLKLAYEEFGLTKPGRIGKAFKNGIIWVNNFVDSIYKSVIFKPVYATAIAAVIMLIIVTAIFNPFQNTKKEEKPFITISSRIRSTIPTRIENESKITGIVVTLKDSTLIFSQPTHFERTVRLYDGKLNQIRTFEIKKPKESIPLSGIPDTDSIIVVIESFDTVVHISIIKF